MSSVFLSYARSDDDSLLKRLHEDLGSEGHDVWWDRVEMPSRGLTFLHEIRLAIDSRERLVVLLDAKAVTSRYVRQEWQYALAVDKIVIPALRDGDYDLIPPELQGLDALDFREDEDYAAALEKLDRNLRLPAPELGEILGVPPVPENYQPRPDATSALAKFVLAELNTPVVLPVAERATVIHGIGGVGKSVLTSGFVRGISARRAFPDGIFWFDCRSESSTADRIRTIGSHFRDDMTHYVDEARAARRLPDLLADRTCLIVLDNVWELDDAAPFARALSKAPHTHLLVTTREKDLASSLGAREHEVDVLTPQASLQTLASWTQQDVDELPPEAEGVAMKCGYLPFALALCGALARDGTPWADLLTDLENAELGLVEKQLLNYPFPDVLKSFKVSLDRLEQKDPGSRPADYYTEAVRVYRELVVFPPGTRVPEQAVLTLWTRRDRVPSRMARKYLVTLAGKQLLRLEGEAPDRRVSMHDLQHDYLRATASKDANPHADLLDAYLEDAPIEAWPDVDDDGYVLTHLMYHLEAAGRQEDLHRLLAVTSQSGRNAWSEARRRGGRVLGIADDVARAWNLALYGDVDAPEARRDERAVQLGRYALMLSSVNSALPFFPHELVTALVASGEWSAEQGWRVARRIDDASSRARGLASLLPYFEGGRQMEIAREVFDAIRDGDTWGIGQMLRDVLPELPAAFQSEVLDIASAQSNYSRMALLEETLPVFEGTAAVRATEMLAEAEAEIEAERERRTAESGKPRAKAETSIRPPDTRRPVSKRTEKRRAKLMKDLPAELDPTLVNDAVDEICRIRSRVQREYQVGSLLTLAESLPPPLRMRAAREAMRAAKGIDSKVERWRRIRGVFPKLTGDVEELARKAAGNWLVQSRVADLQSADFEQLTQAPWDAVLAGSLRGESP